MTELNKDCTVYVPIKCTTCKKNLKNKTVFMRLSRPYCSTYCKQIHIEKLLNIKKKSLVVLQINNLYN